MRAFLLVSLAFLVSVGAVCAASQPDAGLNKPVTVAVKGEALSDIAAILQKQTGVRLRVSREIADQKATVFVDNKSLGSVMNGLASLFHFRWSASASGENRVYTLAEGAKPGQDRASLRQEAIDHAWEELRRRTEQMAELSSKSKDELKQMDDVLLTKYPDMDNPRVLAQLDILRRLRKDTRLAACAAFYKTIPKNVLDALWEGANILYDSACDDKEWQPPEAPAEEIGKVDRPHTVNLRLSVNNDAGNINLVMDGWISFLPGGGCATECMFLGTVEIGSTQTEQHATLPRKPADEVLRKKVTLTTADLAGEAAVPEQGTSTLKPYINKSDLLALLHRKLGLQIISDHYSDWEEFAPVKDASVKDVLETESDVEPSALTADWGWDGKFLYSRVRDPQFFEWYELPNRLLRQLRAAYAKQGYLGLEERADISVLPDEQGALLESACRFLGLPNMPYLTVACRKELRLYGLLSKQQRSQAFHGGIDVEQLTPDQQAALGCLLSPENSRMDNGMHPVGIYMQGRRLDKPADPSAPIPVALEMKDDGIDCRFMDTIQAKGKPSDWIKADSLDAALRQAQKTRPAAKKEDIALQSKRLEYRMVIRFSDGSTVEKSLSIPTYTRAKWSE